MLRIALFTSVVCPSLLCLVLGAVTTTTTAAELYRWTEADGSITFSPTPPPAGTAYEAVGRTVRNDERQPPAGTVGESNRRPASAAGAMAGRDAGQAPATDASEPVLGAARRATGATAGSPAAVSAASDDASDASALRWHDPVVNSQPPQRNRPAARAQSGRQSQAPSDSSLIAADGKDRHCRELAKRVVSLERRLATRLTASQMDDTVVYMARYQRSIDQYCSR